MPQLTNQNKVLLRELQNSLHLGDAARDQILADIGWTRQEYDMGHKGCVCAGCRVSIKPY